MPILGISTAVVVYSQRDQVVTKVPTAQGYIDPKLANHEQPFQPMAKLAFVLT